MEDGSIIPESIVRVNFGGDDLTNLMFDLLHRRKSLHYFPKSILSKHYNYHWQIVNKFKEIYCRWILEERELVKRCTFWVHDKGQNPNQEITINLSDSLQVALLAIFYPELIEAVKKGQSKHMLETPDYYDFNSENPDSEDVIDDILTVLAEQAQSRYGTAPKAKDTASEVAPVEESKTSKTNLQIIESMYEILTLEELITKSICSIKSSETRKKMASKILLTGGTICAKEYVDFVDIIEGKLIDYITSVDNTIEKVDVVQIKDQDPRFFTWVGGSVCPRLETSKDMFITREQWTCTFKNFDDHVKEERVRRVLEKDDEEKRQAEDKNNVVNEQPEEQEENKIELDADSKAFSSKEPAFGKEATEAKQKAESKPKVNPDRGELDLNEKDIRVFLKKERNMDSGFKVLREKIPFQW